MLTHDKGQKTGGQGRGLGAGSRVEGQKEKMKMGTNDKLRGLTWTSGVCYTLNNSYLLVGLLFSVVIFHTY